MVSIGAAGTITTSVTDGTEDNVQTVTVQTPNGLPGVPVSSGGNYTDAAGQQWICDEIDLARGKYVQRVGTYTTGASATWNKNGGDKHIGTKNLHMYISVPGVSRTARGIICDRLDSDRSAGLYNETVSNVCQPMNGQRTVVIDVDVTKWPDIDAWRAWAADNPLTFKYILETPVETDLTAEEIAAYAALRTNKPNTTVFNDAGAHMQVEYVADTKIYTDNKFAELNNAILALGANV
jgi:hypothetical protein